MYIRKFEVGRGTRHTHTHTLDSPIYIMKMASTYFRYFIRSSYPPECVSVCSSFLCGSVFRLFITFTSSVVSFVSWPSFQPMARLFGSVFSSFVSFLFFCFVFAKKTTAMSILFSSVSFYYFSCPLFSFQIFLRFYIDFCLALASTKIHIQLHSVCELE